jgi:hypothetical protein
VSEDGGQEGDRGAGKAPEPEGVAELLRERYPLKKSDRLSIAVEAVPLALRLTLESGRDRYEIAVSYVRGANGRDPWMLTADALDSLYGSFIESGRAYRDLPVGDDVEFDGAFFAVTIERTIPELAHEADRLLERDEDGANGATPRRS